MNRLNFHKINLYQSYLRFSESFKQNHLPNFSKKTKLHRTSSLCSTKIRDRFIHLKTILTSLQQNQIKLNQWQS